MTAVEWLISEIQKHNDLGYEFHPKYNEEIIEQAKEREKQQIVDAYVAGDVNGVESMIDHGFVWVQPEEYYSKTFKSE